jgi:hypothetical protein
MGVANDLSKLGCSTSVELATPALPQQRPGSTLASHFIILVAMGS